MDKYNDSKPSRSRWKDDNRNPKLYDERTDKPGVFSILQNGKLDGKREASNSAKSSRINKTEIVSQINQNLPEDVRISKLLRRLRLKQPSLDLLTSARNSRLLCKIEPMLITLDALSIFLQTR